MQHFPLLVVMVLVGCAQPSGVIVPPHDPEGLHNVRAWTANLLTGSSPEGETGFASLRALGVRTIISVDGAAPEVELARQYGLRYVHLPIGYDQVPREQALRIARAVQEFPGRVYLHCHHGKHRAPAAAAVVCLCLDSECRVATVVQAMREAGTDPRYVGLYTSPAQLLRPNREELSQVRSDFPERAAVSALAQTMVQIDQTWDRLRLVRDAGWQAPSGHADVDPAHEALQLREHYHEMQRQKEFALQPEDYRRWTEEAERDAARLEVLLRRSPIDGSQASSVARAVGQACSRCHARFRDVPQNH